MARTIASSPDGRTPSPRPPLTLINHHSNIRRISVTILHYALCVMFSLTAATSGQIVPTLSDANGGAVWVLDAAVSDEFAGSALDRTRWGQELGSWSS